MTPTEETRRITPGMLAIFAMGWLEIATSLVLFNMGLTPVAVVFAAIAALISFFATQIRRPPWADPPSKSDSGVVLSPALARILPIVIALLAVGSLVSSVYQLVQGTALAAILFALWTISLGIQTIRLWPHK